ncbi:hypothetical protein Hanom_Chr12g01164391 [Helianthus anomalus]
MVQWSWTRLDLAYETYGILLGNCESLRDSLCRKTTKCFHLQ